MGLDFPTCRQAISEENENATIAVLEGTVHALLSGFTTSIEDDEWVLRRMTTWGPSGELRLK